MILVFLFISSSQAAQNKSIIKANFDFETVVDDLPVGWNIFSNLDGYLNGVDTKYFQHGKTSVYIDSNGPKNGFKSISFNIPNVYQGSKITLKGFIKTENVSGGWAGLWLRLDPNAGFDNMQKSGVIGTTDWKQYEISLELKPQETNNIVVGGLLVGSGKMWLDNLSLSIDNKPFNDAPVLELTDAKKDNKFDLGSNIEIANLDVSTTNNLVLLGKIWGFLKYHHQAIAAGKYNWDYELFKILPHLLAAKTDKQRDQLFVGWIDILGDIELCTTCEKTAENAFLKPDLKWIANNNLSTKLQSSLGHIYSNRSQNSHYYFEAGQASNVRFKNEEGYNNMLYPDAGFRLLALYRYWNMIHYFFPYKYLTDKDWSAILAQYLPRFIGAKDELEYEIAALQLIGEVNDTHANLWGGNNNIESTKGDYFPPVLTRMIEQKLVVTDFYTNNVVENDDMSQKVGLKIGDIIIAINGIPVEQIIKQKLPFYPASNNVIKQRNIALDLLRSTDKLVAIEYTRDGQKYDLALSLFKKNELSYFLGFRKHPNQPSYKVLENNIGYVTLENIQRSDIEKIKSELKDTKGIVIDIRNYPSTFVVYSLGSFFMSESTEFTKITKPNLNNPGEFTFLPPLTVFGSTNSYKGKVVILVNEFSISQSEFTAMAFKAAKNSIVIGSTTAGADGNVSGITLPGGLTTSISGLGIYYPDGTETQRVGIIPDIFITPTIEGIKSGKDELLEKAIEEINRH
jgi:C-terminal processing protease CtpA/Prc